MRKALRLLPLPVCIAFSLAAHAADDRPADWRLCPVQDAIPAFPDAQPATHLTSEERAGQPTDIEGDEISGPESNRRITGNVALRRGDQFLGTDQLTFDTGTGHYFATGRVRYQDAGMPLVAAQAERPEDHRVRKE